jgi:hypothetical protein
MLPEIAPQNSNRIPDGTAAVLAGLWIAVTFLSSVRD